MALHKHITSPDTKGFQVRIVRNKKEFSRYFSHNQWGSKASALKSAISWRDQMLVLFSGKNSIVPENTTPPANKSTGILGVTRTIQYDKRNDTHCLVYSCHWRVDGKGHTKTFHVGRIEEVDADLDFHAFRTATFFRKEYELFKEKGKMALFSTDKYKFWKNHRVYENEVLG